MKKKNSSKVINFPANAIESERQVEAILFAAEEPLDLETIESRIKTKTNVLKGWGILSPTLIFSLSNNV